MEVLMAEGGGMGIGTMVTDIMNAVTSFSGMITGAVQSRKGRKMAAEQFNIGQEIQARGLGANASALRNTANKIKKLIDEGGMSLQAGMDRLEAHFQEQGGLLNDWYQEQMRLGTEQLALNRQMVVDNLRRNITVAQRNVDRQQRDYLEDEKRKLDRIQEDFEKSNEQVREQLTNERLGNSGAFLEAVAQSQKTYGDIQNQMGQSRSQYFRGLAEGFTDVVNDVGFRTQQAQQQFDLASTGLQREIGGQYRESQMQQARERLGAEEAWRQQSFDIGTQLATLEGQAEGAEAMGKALMEAPRLTTTGKQRRAEEDRQTGLGILKSMGAPYPGFG